MSPKPNEFKLPRDAWIGLHQDGTVCLDWSYGGVISGGVFPMIRFTEKEPPQPAECEEEGEALVWQRASLMAQNAAVTAGGRGAVRFQEDDDV